MNKPRVDKHRDKPDRANSGAVRIIGGRWRGTRLAVADRPGLRPTSDRVRETLFNWLQFELQGARVLDLFAGSGALGLEAASRGAARVELVESDPGLAQALQAMVDKLDAAAQVAVHRADARHFLAQWQGGGFDIAFVDPPFAAGLWTEILPALAGKMSASAWIYVESPAGQTPDPGQEWALHREKRTREVRYALFRRGKLMPMSNQGD